MGGRGPTVVGIEQPLGHEIGAMRATLRPLGLTVSDLRTGGQTSGEWALLGLTNDGGARCDVRHDRPSCCYLLQGTGLCGSFIHAVRDALQLLSLSGLLVDVTPQLITTADDPRQAFLLLVEGRYGAYASDRLWDPFDAWLVELSLGPRAPAPADGGS